VALTTSGNSPNVNAPEWRPGVRAARFLWRLQANWRRARRQGWPSLECSFERRQRIQECHITIGHIACSLIEQLVCG